VNEIKREPMKKYKCDFNATIHMLVCPNLIMEYKTFVYMSRNNQSISFVVIQFDKVNYKYFH